MKKNLSSNIVAFLLVSLLLISSLGILLFNIGFAQEDTMTFTSGETINFSSDTEMTFKDYESMQFWSGDKMKFGTNITIQFIEIEPDGVLVQCDWLQIIWSWPRGYIPPECSWWEVIDPETGELLGEFHVDLFESPDWIHIDIVWPGPIPIPPGGVITAKKKVDIIEPCEIYVVHWPEHWYPEPCTWWEILDPETGELTGFEFHVDWTNESCEFHIDIIIPEPYYPPFPWYEIWARRKIPSISPCDYFVVEEPPHWWPEPCTWWEILDPWTGKPTGYNFHVDWTNESCEFHVDWVEPEPYVFTDPTGYPTPVPYVIAEKKIVNITACDWFIIIDPIAFLPEPCSWWEILDDTGAPTGWEFHVDVTDGIDMFHVDEVVPGEVIHIPPSYTVTVRKKIDVIQQCDWFRVDDPLLTPEPCSWWKIIYPEYLDDVEIHVDIAYPDNGTFHIDYADPIIPLDPPLYEVIAERKIDDIEPCDWFLVIDPPGFVPEPCSWWEIIWPIEWAGVIFHVDGNEGDWFHIDDVDGGGVPPPPTPPPWNVTAKPYEPPPEPWYIKAPYPDYAPSGMPDFDQRQDRWGPADMIYTWCGPTAVANSLWWLDSEFESLFNPSPVPPPTISDSFPLVMAYGPWDDHDPLNVMPFVLNLAWLMDTDGQQSGDGHIGTRVLDMVNGIQQYLIHQGMEGMFWVDFMQFPEFEWIEYEIMICEDVVLFLEFWQDLGGGDWMPLYDDPSLEFGHYVTCAGVNSTTYELLISDPIQDAFEKGATFGRSPVSHPWPHGTDLHNDTQYVSHDGYGVNFWPDVPYPNPYGPPVWELVGYLLTLGYDPSWHAFIAAAVVTSPWEEVVHDVAVIDVKPAAPGPGVKTIVFQGYDVDINVTVENQGDFTETFDVTLKANTTVIGSQTVTNLVAGDTFNLTFTWSPTTGTPKGNYTLTAIADTVPGETDTADNTYDYEMGIYVSYVGDLTGGSASVWDFVPDGKVDGKDMIIVARCFGSWPAAPPPLIWHPNCDVNDDNKVDGRDLIVVARHFGEADP